MCLSVCLSHCLSTVVADDRDVISDTRSMGPALQIKLGLVRTGRPHLLEDDGSTARRRSLGSGVAALGLGDAVL